MLIDEIIDAFVSVVPAVTGLVGAVIGGLFALYAGKQAHNREIDKHERARQEHLLGYLKSLKNELNSLWIRYVHVLGSEIDKRSSEPQAFYTRFSVTADFFSVYHGNAFLVGYVPDDNLRYLIVATYTQAKGMIETLKVNTELSLRAEALRMYGGSSDLFEQFERELSLQFTYVKRDHEILKDLILKCLASLDQEIAKLEREQS